MATLSENLICHTHNFLLVNPCLLGMPTQHLPSAILPYLWQRYCSKFKYLYTYCEHSYFGLEFLRNLPCKQALKTVGLSSSQPPQQNLPTGSAVPQHLTMHPYSQPTLPLGPFANMIGYPFLPQSYTYMPSGFQPAYAGNSAYHQQLAAMLPQYKNNVSASSLPQSANVASGYGSFGGSTAVPGNYQVSQPAGPAGSNISYEDLLNAHYKDNSHLVSLQQVSLALGPVYFFSH